MLSDIEFRQKAIKFSEAQQIQEDQYNIPYHWFFTPFDYKGRVYFGTLSRCLDLIDLPAFFGKKILDAGCGDGRFIRLLNDKGDYDVSGFDFSEKAVAMAQALTGQDNLRVASLLSLPYDNHQFDLIFLIDVLEHVPLVDVKSVIMELSRILSPDGTLIVSVPSKLLDFNSKHYQHFTDSTLRSAFKGIFNVEEIIGQDHHYKKILKFFYKIFDNRYYQIKSLTHWYNETIYRKYLNDCSSVDGNRLVARLRKA